MKDEPTPPSPGDLLSPGLPPSLETDPNRHLTGRDNKGRWTKGNAGGPGRTKGSGIGIDLRKLAEDRLGPAFPDRMWALLEAMFARAMDGDVAAAKLLFERLGIPESKTQLRVTMDLTPEDRAARVQELLSRAATRRIGVELLEDNEDEGDAES